VLSESIEALFIDLIYVWNLGECSQPEKPSSLARNGKHLNFA